MTPVVNEVNENEEPLERPVSTPSTPPATKSSAEPDKNVLTLPLKAEWEMIANHALFQDELKNYFRSFRLFVDRTNDHFDCSRRSTRRASGSETKRIDLHPSEQSRWSDESAGCEQNEQFYAAVSHRNASKSKRSTPANPSSPFGNHRLETSAEPRLSRCSERRHDASIERKIVSPETLTDWLCSWFSTFDQVSLHLLKNVRNEELPLFVSVRTTHLLAPYQVPGERCRECSS